MANLKTSFKGLKLHPGQVDMLKGILSTAAMFITICTPRQWGKSKFIIQLILNYAINNPDSKVMFASLSYRQCSKVYNELIKGIEFSGIILKKNSVENSIILINGTEIYFVSVQQPENLLGYDIDYMFVDEAALVKDSTFERVLRPFLRVRGKKCFLFSTPRGKNYFYKMFTLGMNEEEPHYMAFKGTPDGNPYANKEEFEAAKKSLPDAIFRQEYLAEFVDGGVVFPNLTNNAIITSWKGPISGERYFAGLDIAMHGDFLVLTILDSKGNIVNSYRDNMKKMSFMIDNIGKLLKQYNPISTIVETNGIGNGIYEYIEKTHRSVQPFNTSNKSKQDIIEDLIYEFNEDKIKIPTSTFFPYYIDELTDFGFDYNPKSRKVVYQAISGHDDCVMSLAFANHARKYGATKGRMYQY